MSDPSAMRCAVRTVARPALAAVGLLALAMAGCRTAGSIWVPIIVRTDPASAPSAERDAQPPGLIAAARPTDPPATITLAAFEEDASDDPVDVTDAPTLPDPTEERDEDAGDDADDADDADEEGEEGDDGDAAGDDPPDSAIDDALEDLTSDAPSGSLTLAAVIDSVYRSYPLLRASLTERQRAAGQQLEAYGGYDHVLDGSTQNKPQYNFENYRHDLGVSRNIYANGGRWYAGYRLGRGAFEPWYLERETNDGGEFRLGLVRPLQQGRAIDAQRAALWRATYERARVEPAIQAELIDYVLSASAAYWAWVAAGQRYELASDLLQTAEQRAEQLERLVELETLAPPVLPENERLVLTRRGALAAAERGLRQAIARLSAFYRTADGRPLVVPEDVRVPFSPIADPDPAVETDLPDAIVRRPAIRELVARRQSQEVTLAKARNELLPKLDAAAFGKQDIGGRSSRGSVNTKGEFEFEASLLLNVPIERRAAKGRILQAEAALAQTAARTQLAEDRVRIDLEVAAAAIGAAAARVEAAEASVGLAKRLVAIERRRFQLGDSSLLEITLREQQLLDSATALIDAHFDAHVAEAEYRAALATDALPDTPPPYAPPPFAPPCECEGWADDHRPECLRKPLLPPPACP